VALRGLPPGKSLEKEIMNTKKDIEKMIKAFRAARKAGLTVREIGELARWLKKQK
jgi:hypothetical protein